MINPTFSGKNMAAQSNQGGEESDECWCQQACELSAEVGGWGVVPGVKGDEGGYEVNC